MEVGGVGDLRMGGGTAAAAARERGIDIRFGHAVVGTAGDSTLAGVQVAALGSGDAGQTIEGNLLGVAGGFNAVVHLASRGPGPLHVALARQGFLSGTGGPGVRVVRGASRIFEAGRPYAMGG